MYFLQFPTEYLRNHFLTSLQGATELSVNLIHCLTSRQKEQVGLPNLSRRKIGTYFLLTESKVVYSKKIKVEKKEVIK